MERYNYQREREISHRSNPSFSSTLLDSIYRSIDKGDEDLVPYKETMRKKQSTSNRDGFQKACMIENWMETEKVMIRRKSTHDFERKSRNLANSSSSSSDSSCGGVFSSNSETESSSCYGLNKPKPIRTSDFSVKTKNHETGFVKTKIYGDLKKVKKPISPGARLATFLNSIFTNSKKSKLSVSSSNSATTCSSASSFSRSCLSKNTPKSNGKRSVRFEEPNLESVKNIRNKINEELKLHEKNRRVEEAAKELLRNYQKNQVFDDDDDGASCASSDLFELDNLSAIGMQELPVYETTHFDSSRFRNGVRI